MKLTKLPIDLSQQLQEKQQIIAVTQYLMYYRDICLGDTINKIQELVYSHVQMIE
jgi:hypothetical protein